MAILLVEDEQKVGDLVSRELRAYHYAVTWARTARDAAEAMARDDFDLVVLDLSLPDSDGLDLLASWRDLRYAVPVLILSARSDVEDRVKGLDLGADDYLAKPFSIAELVARVRSLQRRQGIEQAAVMELRGLCVDLNARRVTLNGEEIELTRREFDLIQLFIVNKGRVLTRGQISEKVWGSDREIETNLIDVYIRKLRHKLHPPQGEGYFKTLRGVGYKMV